FGFLGGITGVMMGQMQLNLTWHNTLAVPGHFHGTVVTGTTLAFMGLAYYVIKLVFRKDWVGGLLATIQPYFYGGSMAVVVLMMMYLGVLFGVPRRHPSVMDIPGTDFSFAPAAPLFAIFGIFAILAVTGGALFLLLAVASLLFGDEYGGADPDDPAVVADGGEAAAEGIHLQTMRGTFIFALVFLGVFALMWALNWYLLANLWQIG
ncbi:MAG: cbb3-type cytochrome c oxidase subunit I, partial [Halobacteriales archaeon]